MTHLSTITHEQTFTLPRNLTEPWLSLKRNEEAGSYLQSRAKRLFSCRLLERVECDNQLSKEREKLTCFTGSHMTSEWDSEGKESLKELQAQLSLLY